MRSLFLTLCCLAFFACEETKTPLIGNLDIIPLPQTIKDYEGHFLLTEKTKIHGLVKGDDWKLPVDYLNDKIEKATGKRLVINQEELVWENMILFTKDSLIAEEGYELSISKQGVFIRSSTAQGAFYGVQTLLQMLPPSFLSNKKTKGLNVHLPFVEIKDEPRFSYRGMHLDVCRHFFSVEEVKRYIDLMALHKNNFFHWHLTEDQGWRIEIKAYPKLTEVGAYRKETLVGHYNDQPHQFDGKRYGGFYTQKEIKEVVKYAQDRFITIIPEIEMPGHAQAAIAAYPELGCTNDRLEVLTKWGISDNVYCPTEATFTFLTNVLNEVMDLFPGPYIHIGGDECPKTQWNESAFCQALIKRENLKDAYGLQSYFLQRIEKVIEAKGKSMMGWDEILEGGLAPNATVMSWRGMKGGIEAAMQNHQVIMTPTSHCYFDYYQSQDSNEPLAIGGYLPLKTVYDFEPIPKELPKEKQHYVLGAQANLWTEYIPNQTQLDYMTYPRACAIAEVNWSAKDSRDYSSFIKRLLTHLERLAHLDVNYATAFFDLDADFKTVSGDLEVSLKSDIPTMAIRYTLDGENPSKAGVLYEGPFVLKESANLQAIGEMTNGAEGRLLEKAIHFHKGVGKKIQFSEAPAAQYSAGGTGCVLNGIKGSDTRYGDKEWLGFWGKDIVMDIDLGEVMSLDSIQFRFFKGEGQWIYLPKKIAVSTSTNGKQFKPFTSSLDIQTDGKIATPTIKIKTNTRYLRIKVNRFGIIPDGAQGAGHEAWLFLDEMVIN